VSRPVISLLMVLTITASSTLLTLAIATLFNCAAPYDQSFAALNGVHLWLYFDRDRLRTRDIERIEAMPEVIASTGVQYSVATRVRIHGTRVWTSLHVLATQMPTVNSLLIQDGRYLMPGQKEMLGSSDLHDFYDLAVGDIVEVTASDHRRVDLPIVGLAYNPTWDTYRNSQPPYLYVSERTMRQLFPEEQTWEKSVGLRLEDPDSADTVLATIEETLRPHTIIGHTDWRDVREAAIFGAQLNLVFLGAFSIFAVIATILVIASSISSTVLSQFRQIGILKAIGFSRAHILWVYSGQYLILTALAGPLGLLVGTLLSPLPLRSVAASLSTTFKPALTPALFAIVLAMVNLVVLGATLRAARRGARANIVQAMAIGAEPPRRRSFWGARWTKRFGLPVVLSLGINDISVRPGRSLMTGLNLALGVIGIIFGIALHDTLNRYEQDPSLLGIVYDAVVTRQEHSDRHTRSEIGQAPGIAAFYAEQLVDVEDTRGHTFQIRAVEGDLDQFPFRISSGRPFDPDSVQALAGQGLLSWLGLKVGDSLTLTQKDSNRPPITWQIVGTYPEPVNAGQMLMVGLPVLRSAHWDSDPHTYYLRLAPDADGEETKNFLQPRANSDLNVIFVGQSLPDAVVYLQLAILTLSAILISIALINVFNTSILSVREKLRTLGILKTVGMTPGQVVAMISTSTAVLGVLATIVGVPVGLAFSQVLLSTLSRSYGFGQVHVTVNIALVLLLIPLMILVSIVGSLWPSLRAAHTPIVEVLRYE